MQGRFNHFAGFNLGKAETDLPQLQACGLVGEIEWTLGRGGTSLAGI
jgi:hypothetical protein